MSAQDFAYLHHFRGRCDQKFEPWRCKEFLTRPRVDPVLVRYRDDMRKRVKSVLDYMQVT